MFQPGHEWRDDTGAAIQAHGGGVMYHQGVYYWFGENKDAPNAQSADALLDRVDVIGISCYSSRDLHTWKYEGLALPAVKDDPTHDLHPSKVVERPKTLYNPITRRYVMWFHSDTANYETARVGVAVSETPTGPYRYQGSFRPGGLESRDMTLFQDDDGTAYLIFSTDWNANLAIARLSDDYLRVAYVTKPTAFLGRKREAPAVFAYAGRYYLITSGCTGWAPNPAEYAVATSLLGDWELHGSPCVGEGAMTTYDAQSAFVLPVAEKEGAFIFMADRWLNTNLRDSRYVWLPIILHGDDLMIPWHERWDLSVFA